MRKRTTSTPCKAFRSLTTMTFSRQGEVPTGSLLSYSKIIIVISKVLESLMLNDSGMQRNKTQREQKTWIPPPPENAKTFCCASTAR